MKIVPRILLIATVVGTIGYGFNFYLEQRKAQQTEMIAPPVIAQPLSVPIVAQPAITPVTPQPALPVSPTDSTGNAGLNKLLQSGQK